jgi:hypothetical protein
MSARCGCCCGGCGEGAVATNNPVCLEWPGEIDFCADALWFEAHPEDAPEHANLEPAR